MIRIKTDEKHEMQIQNNKNHENKTKKKLEK